MKHIDLWMPKRQEALKWGNPTKKVWILSEFGVK